jgi:hypothetical protein
MHYMELCVSTALYCADLDPTFPFDAGPHPDPDLYLKLYTSWKVRIYFNNSMPVIIFLTQKCHRSHNCEYFRQHIEILW